MQTIRLWRLEVPWTQGGHCICPGGGHGGVFCWQQGKMQPVQELYKVLLVMEKQEMLQRSRYLVRKLWALGKVDNSLATKDKNKFTYCLVSGRCGIRNRKCHQTKCRSCFKQCDLYCLLTIFSAQHRTSYTEGEEWMIDKGRKTQLGQ